MTFVSAPGPVGPGGGAGPARAISGPVRAAPFYRVKIVLPMAPKIAMAITRPLDPCR